MNRGERPFSAVVTESLENIGQIVGAEARLARGELRSVVVRAAVAAMLLAVGAATALMTALLLTAACVIALSRVMPAWAASLLVAAPVCMLSILLISIGLGRIRAMRPLMSQTIRRLKENIAWARQLNR